MFTQIQFVSDAIECQQAKYVGPSGLPSAQVGKFIRQNFDYRPGEVCQRPHVPYDVAFTCARLEICKAVTWRFKTRPLDDDTFEDACNQTLDRPMDNSCGNCKHCDSRRLFVWSVGELLESGEPFDSSDGTRWRAPRPCDSPFCGCSFENRTVVYDASNRSRCHSTDYRASFTPADDTGTPGRAPDHVHHASTGATCNCSAAGAGQPVCEYVARSRLLKCLLF